MNMVTLLFFVKMVSCSKKVLFMVYSCKYNPITDLKKVSPTGALDLKAAFANNSIPANLDAKAGSYNMIDDPAAIAGRITDNIDAAMAEKSISGYKAPENE